jgi:hypothetical protein
MRRLPEGGERGNNEASSNDERKSKVSSEYPYHPPGRVRGPWSAS